MRKGRNRKIILGEMFQAEWHLRFPRAYKFWEWVVMPRTSGGRLGVRNWIRYCLRSAFIALWLVGCAGSQTRTVVATPTQAAAIREILGKQLPDGQAGQVAYFLGSQRQNGHLVLAVGCK